MKVISTFLKPRFAFVISAFTSVFFALSGCGGSSSNSSNNASNPTSSTRSGENTLTIISPHGKEIQNEFERGFKGKYPDAKLKWIDQGGSSDALRFVLDQFGGKTGEQGIGIDVFFGGGADSFQDMENAKVLQTLPSEYSIPVQIDGVPLRGKNNVWVAAALSGFGILSNRAIMQRDNLPVLQTWSDLGNPQLRGRVALADPRHSGSAHMAYEIILQANGWDKGWKILTQMAGNSSAFGKSSSRLLEDVSSGEAVAAPAIDFYALSKVAGANGKLSYVEPAGQRVLAADPIGILRGAPQQKMARDFVAFVMSAPGQKLWMLEKGAAGGPQNETLYRLAALPSLYQPIPAGSVIKADPYASRNNFKFDPQKSALRRRALDDLLGATLIDNLRDVQNWTKQNPNRVYIPLSENELNQFAIQLNEDSKRDKDKSGKRKNKDERRNAQISAWNQAARAFFKIS